MRYEITIRELQEFTPEELEKEDRRNRSGMDLMPPYRYSDKPFHETRVLNAEVSKEEFEAVKKAIIGVM